MANDITIPLASEALTDASGAPTASWYRILAQLVAAFNAGTRDAASTASTVADQGTQLDAIDILTTRGDLLTRDATGYKRLPIGSNGQGLVVSGPDVAWGSSSGGATLIASGSLSGATVVITSIPATYAYLVLIISGASCDTASRTLLVQVSVDNGSSYDAGAANYIGYTLRTDSVGTVTLDANGSLLGNIGSVAAAATQNVSLSIFGYHGGGYPFAPGMNSQSTPASYSTFTHYIGSTTAINALQLLWNGSGNFDAGSYALYGVR